MRAGEGERSFVVIELRTRPAGRAVAYRAVGRESRLHVVGIRRALEIFHVTSGARSGRSCESAIGVTLLAGHAGVRSGQGKLREGVVIEGRRLPRRGRVAGLARGRKCSSYVIGILCAGKILLMTSKAGRGRARKAPTCVAGSACQLRVRSGQRKSCELQVVEAGAEPGIHPVALLARGGKSRLHVIGRRGRLVALGVAGVAIGGQTDELPRCRAFVAGIAVEHGMRAHQRKAVLVVLNRLDGNVPALHRMAALAIRAELATVNVSVAVPALVADIRKNGFGVALRAGHVLVHAAKREARFVVIELRDVADRLPRRECVAVLAGNRQRSVRAARITGIGRLRRRRGQSARG